MSQLEDTTCGTGRDVGPVVGAWPVEVHPRVRPHGSLHRGDGLGSLHVSLSSHQSLPSHGII